MAASNYPSLQEILANYCFTKHEMNRIEQVIGEFDILELESYPSLKADLIERIVPNTIPLTNFALCKIEYIKLHMELRGWKVSHVKHHLFARSTFISTLRDLRSESETTLGRINPSPADISPVAPSLTAFTQQAESSTSPRVEVDDAEKDLILTEESPEPEDKNEQPSEEKSDEIAATFQTLVELTNQPNNTNNDAEENEDPSEGALITQPDNANAVTNTATMSQNEEKDKANDIFDDTSSSSASSSSSSSTSTESSDSDEDEAATKDKQKVESNKNNTSKDNEKQSATEAAKKTPSTLSNLKMLTPKSNKRKEKDKSKDIPESPTGPKAVDSTVAAKSNIDQKTEATSLESLMSPRSKHPKLSDEEINEIKIQFEGNKDMSKTALREIGRQLNIYVKGTKEELFERVQMYFQLKSEQIESEKNTATSPDKAKKKRKVTITMARKDPADETNNSHLEV